MTEPQKQLNGKIMKKIKAMREKLGYTTYDVAEGTGLPQSSINAWEMNRNPISVYGIRKIAEFFKANGKDDFDIFS